MRAEPKTQRFLLPAFPIHVELVWIGKDFFVAIGGLIRGDDSFTGFDLFPAELNVGLRDAPHSEPGTGVVAAKLFDEGGCQGGVGFEVG